MFREIAFIHEGAQYFTVTGSQYLLSTLNTNAATSVTINSKASYQSEMRKLNNGSSRFALEIPMVENAEVTAKDGFFYLKGVVKADGKEYKVELTKDELKIEGDKAEEPAPKEEPAPAPAPKKEQPAPAPALEPKKEQPAPAPVKPVEEKKEEPAPAPKESEEKKAFVMGEASQPPEARPPKQVSKPKEKARGFVLGEKRATDVSQQLVLGEANQVEGCVFRGRVQVPGKPRGRYNNGMRHPRGTQLVDQSYTEHTQPARRRVEETVQEQPERRPMFPQPPVTRQEPVEPYVQEVSPAPIIPDDLDTANLYDRPLGERESTPTSPFKSAEELAKEYRAANGINIGVSVHNTTPAPLGATVEENAQPKSRKDRAEEKRKVRAMLSEEVSAIIGDIPHEMLGSIEEFTTDVVDSATLNKQGNLFCIDHRWHKNGNWFCIDVVPNAARYFYNNTRDVSMEISLKDLRAWQQAIG